MAWYNRLLSPSAAPSASRRRLLRARAPRRIAPGTLVDARGRTIDRDIRGGDPFVGEISMFAGNFAPRGWAFCDGQLLAVSQNDALFSLLGTIYGGDGRSTFGLPDLRGRVPVSQGQGPGLSNYPIGSKRGTERLTTVSPHTHSVAEVQVRGSGTQTTGLSVGGEITPTVTATTGANIVPPGGDNNIQPVLGIHFIISLFGIYPSRF